MKTAEKIFLIALIIIGVTLFWGSEGMNTIFQEPLTSEVYGELLSGLLIVLCLIKLIMLQIKKQDSETKEDVAVNNMRIIIIQAVLMILYTIGITTIGYFVTTFIYLLIMLILLTDTAKTKTAIIKFTLGSAAFTAALYALFTVFNVFLPKSLLF
ncbi:Tripartite tricarboxylate transporter TctB family protein [Desulfotomaculum arcticum]|uniref:Tripartite tricarboxylate transporter TctB family protein n=1 Tax=Desulfotruncus arcticus DSM 17038 TaxID=1121424 RepID=A0A1I2WRU7_9FIRM|nr:tripartite tricarboxylate transporter TctB family protein [Desulfotruncus arcticus]SFH03086.1 Tripartite tricarboxylate transporter TctB family protein [Desulfotomaculum arcticum] [Desulfotruncus arcticus DSM 17038]